MVSRRSNGKIYEINTSTKNEFSEAMAVSMKVWV